MEATSPGPEPSEAALLALVADEEALARGGRAFQASCARCHGFDGRGPIGADLTDGEWLHGGQPLEVYRTVRDGITPDQAHRPGSGGMPAWGTRLTEDQLRSVTAFVLSLSGREPGVAESAAPE